MTEEWELVSKATEFIAEEMGVALQRSALSPNIRERMDHSCAVVAPSGAIVAQAEHIPVHLGSFKVGVEQLLAALRSTSSEPGRREMILVNDPYITGTHLNDLMVLAPVHWRGSLVGFVTNKAHHVDVGGSVPGSLNPRAGDLFGEGVVVPPTTIVRASRLDAGAFRILGSNVRDPEVARGDLEAQIAANRMGVARVRDLFDRFGKALVERSWEESRSRVSATVARALGRMRHGRFSAADAVELGPRMLPIRVSLRVSGAGVLADFQGTSEQVAAPLNAVLGVTYSATAFAVRAALAMTFPTNAGFYDRVQVRAPPGSLVNPDRPAPVSGGNVETSQRIADVVLEALAPSVPHPIPAASSGTMMNIMVGGRRASGRRWAYYETIGGGSGGRSSGNGVSGVHTNMTNTLNTPVEVAEKEYPLLFTSYALRPGSGGVGRFRGGDGLVRGFRLLEPATVSVISDRFYRGPPGRDGGASGRPGRVRLRFRNREKQMPSKFTVDLEPGAEIIVETPGGGGFGAPTRRPRRPSSPAG